MPRTPPPAKLYKYQPFNAQTLGNLVTGKIRFTAPRDFNDPFDCALPLIDPSRLTEADFVRIFEYYKTQMSPEHLAALCPEGGPGPKFRSVIINSVRSGFDDRRTEMLERRGIACLSADPLNITMWSHYADGHRGFCLEFDTRAMPFSEAYHVRYTDDFPYLNPAEILVDDFDGDPENPLLVASVLTKATCWQYEQEWRVLHMVPNQLFGYGNALTAVYVGAATPIEHQEVLGRVLHGSPTILYRVRRGDKGFALHAERGGYAPPTYAD